MGSTKRYLLEGQACAPIWDDLGLWEVDDTDDPEFAVAQAFNAAYPDAKPYRRLRVSKADGEHVAVLVPRDEYMALVGGDGRDA